MPRSGSFFPVVALPILVSCGATVFTAGPAVGQSLEEMRNQLQILQRRIDQLEAEQRRQPRRPAPRPQPAAEAQAAARAEAAAKAAQTAAEAAQARAQAAEVRATQAEAQQAEAGNWRGSFPDSFRIPGTETSVRLYGFAKLNMLGDFGPRNRSDAITGQAIPLSRGANDARNPGDFQASGRRSRLGFETRTDISPGFGEIRTQVEIDFAGQTNDLTTQATLNSYTPRLRQGFAEFGRFDADGWGRVLIGQSNSLFNDNAITPLQWLNDWDPLGISNVRQAQLRYSRGFAGGLTASVALENSYSDVTTSSGTSFPDQNGGAGFGINAIPDLTARAIWQGDWGYAAVRGMVRQVRIQNRGATDPSQRYSASSVGYGIGLSGAVNLLDKRLILAANVNYGDGIGRYLNSTSSGFGAVGNFGLDPAQGGGTRIDTVEVLGGVVGGQYWWTPQVRTNAFLHGARLWYPSYVSNFSSSTRDLVNRSIWAGVVNLIWSPVPAIDLGIEYIHTERILETRDAAGVGGGKSDRIQGSAIVRF
jgi:hypothetical protein